MEGVTDMLIPGDYYIWDDDGCIDGPFCSKDEAFVMAERSSKCYQNVCVIFVVKTFEKDK